MPSSTRPLMYLNEVVHTAEIQLCEDPSSAKTLQGCGDEGKRKTILDRDII